MSKHIELAVDILVNEMVDSGAPNYKSWLMDCDNGSEYLVTVQKRDGETAVEQLAKQKEEIAELVSALKICIYPDVDGDVYITDEERNEFNSLVEKHIKG